MASQSSSDDEMPEVVTSIKMTSEREIELREMFSQKRKLRDEVKLKRRLKTEKFAQQKKEKQARQKLEEQEAELPHTDIEDPNSEANESKSSGATNLPISQDMEILSDVHRKKTNQHKKIYPKFNVVVEPLTRISNPRAAAAISFKEKRLGKVPRENLASNLISYQEKLLVKNT